MELYQRYGRALLRKAERLLQNREDAEDIVQALFVDMWLRGQEAASLPYLYRATTNRCLNHIRDRTNHRRLLDLQQPALRAVVRTSCEDRVVDMDLLLKLASTLDRKTTEVLVYRYLDDMTQEEIASLTGYTRKTVARRLKLIQSSIHRLLDTGPGDGSE